MLEAWWQILSSLTDHMLGICKAALFGTILHLVLETVAYLGIKSTVAVYLITVVCASSIRRESLLCLSSIFTGG